MLRFVETRGQRPLRAPFDGDQGDTLFLSAVDGFSNFTTCNDAVAWRQGQNPAHEKCTKWLT
jgi:hypothetical protein